MTPKKKNASAFDFWRHFFKSKHIKDNFAKFPRTCPNFPKLDQENFEKVPPKLKKRLHLILGIICCKSKHIKWFRKGFHTLSSSFPGILSRFQGNVPGFSPDQNFWGYACTPCTHAYYTSGKQHFAWPRLQHFMYHTYLLTLVAWISMTFCSCICAQKISAYNRRIYAHHLWKFEVILMNTFGVRYFGFATTDARSL